MNSTFDLINGHKTIRKFKEQGVDEKAIQKILDTAMRTPTALGLQQMSIIRVKDQNSKDKISKICSQGYVSEAAELFIFIVDLYRNYRISELDEDVLKGDFSTGFLFGMCDALLMVQNVNNMVESLGMGGVYLGSILNDARELIDMLELPKLTFPVLGYAFGYPDQNPEFKPRMKSELRVFDDKYKVLDDYRNSIKDYDKAMSSYYDLRDTSKPLDTFTKQVENNMKNVKIKSGKNIFDIISEQGFNLI